MKQEARTVSNDIPSRSEGEHRYRLYISSTSPISSRAVVNARRFLEEFLPGKYHLAVMNIAENIDKARADQIVASPTLMRIWPLPQRRFIGDLSDTERLRRSLDAVA